MEIHVFHWTATMYIELYCNKLTEVTGQKSSQCAMEANRRVFSELISTLEKMKEELNRTIQEQEEVLVSQAQKEETKQKVSIQSLQAAIANLEILSDVKEDIIFIQKSQSVTSQQEADVVLLRMNESLSFEFIISVIYTLKQVLEDGCKDAVGKVQKTVRDVQLLDKQKHPGRPSVHRSLTSVGGPRPT
ncbi:hypothetical protein NFI96_025278, partial [Prochilodus magdalenae]